MFAKKRSRQWHGTLVFSEVLILSVLALARFAVPVALEVVSEDLLEKYRETPDSSVVDSVDLVADHVLCTVAQGYHQFAQDRLGFPVTSGCSFIIIDEKR